MQAKEGIIKLLNSVLTHELTAINQHFIHAKMCHNWGFERLQEKIRERSIDEMKDAEQIIERILYLEGVPNLQRIGSLSVGETVPEQLQLDLRLEHSATKLLSDGIAHCLQVADYTTHTLLEHMLEGAEEHVDWLETQLGLIQHVGLPGYLAQQIHENE